jgi:hypothetical protein
VGLPAIGRGPRVARGGSPVQASLLGTGIVACARLTLAFGTDPGRLEVLQEKCDAALDDVIRPPESGTNSECAGHNLREDAGRVRPPSSLARSSCYSHCPLVNLLRPTSGGSGTALGVRQTIRRTALGLTPR